MRANVGLNSKVWHAGKTVAADCAGFAASSVAFGLVAASAVALAKTLYPEALILQTPLGAPFVVSSIGSLGMMGLVTIGIAPEAALRGWGEAGLKAAPKLADLIHPLLKNVGPQLACGAACMGSMAAWEATSGLASGGIFLCGVASVIGMTFYGILKPGMDLIGKRIQQKDEETAAEEARREVSPPASALPEAPVSAAGLQAWRAARIKHEKQEQATSTALGVGR